MGKVLNGIIGKRIKELRQRHNLTQRELAKQIGITASALSAYEKNEVKPSIPIIAEIAKQFKVSTDWLLGLSDKKRIGSEINTYADLFETIVELTTNEWLCGDCAELIKDKDKYLLDITCFVEDERTKPFIKILDTYIKIINLYDAFKIDDFIFNAIIEQFKKDCNALKDPFVEEEMI